jgi:hypothetical protein
MMHTHGVLCPAVLMCVQANHKAWVSDPLEQVDAEAVEKEVQAAYKVLYTMNKVGSVTADFLTTCTPLLPTPLYLITLKRMTNRNYESTCLVNKVSSIG